MAGGLVDGAIYFEGLLVPGGEEAGCFGGFVPEEEGFVVGKFGGLGFRLCFGLCGFLGDGGGLLLLSLGAGGLRWFC